MSFLEPEFMRRALLAALFVGLAAPAVGVFLVQRRLALLGDGVGHVALTGVAAGFLTGLAPLLTAVAAAVTGAVAIELLRRRGRTSGDVALAVLFYGGIAGGVLLTSVAGRSGTALVSYLFGSVTSVDSADLLVISLLAAGVLGVLAFFGRELFSVCYDEEVAQVGGLPVRFLSLLLAVTAALTVTLAMRVVGLLLVSALMVVPVAAAQQLTRSFASTVGASLGLGVLSSVGGLIAAYYVDAAPGATIVVLAIGVFAVTAVLGRVRA